MGNKLYVGNLSFRVTSEDLQEYFGAAGAVESANVVYDRETGRSRGFGFVEMQNAADAQKAIEKLHQHQMEGRAIVVNEAQPKPAGGGRPFGPLAAIPRVREADDAMLRCRRYSQSCE